MIRKRKEKKLSKGKKTKTKMCVTLESNISIISWVNSGVSFIDRSRVWVIVKRKFISTVVFIKNIRFEVISVNVAKFTQLLRDLEKRRRKPK